LCIFTVEIFPGENYPHCIHLYFNAIVGFHLYTDKKIVEK